MANTIEVPLAHYKELAESHARLLEAAHAVVVADDDQTLGSDEIETLRESIAAAQQFTTEGEK